MASRITTRFFRIAPFAAATPLFEDTLSEIAAIVDKGERFRDAGGEEGEERKVRLERLSVDGDFVLGEFTRLQDHDIPPQVTDDGLKPVKLDGEGLGHCAAFILHKPTRCIALQINVNSVSHNSISGYMHAYKASAQYALLPVPTKSTWEEFEAAEPRAITVGIAAPKNLGAINDESDPLIDAFGMFGDMFDGHVVTVEVSVGRKRDKVLEKGVVRKYLELMLGLQPAKGSKVRSLSVQSNKKNEVGEFEDINFLKELLKEKDAVDLPADDAESNYKIRSSVIKKSLTKHIGYLTEFFG